jgi:hypothetical protein
VRRAADYPGNVHFARWLGTRHRLALESDSSVSLGQHQRHGGRFNIGDDLDRARGQAFPCLYLAHDIDTAYREYFGGSLTDRAGKLTLGEFALRRPISFTTFSLRGSLDQVFDLRERSGLTQFAKIIAQFDVSTDTKAFARRVGLQQRKILKTSHQLWKRLLIGPAEWRAEPQMSGIPAASQIFGRFVRDAGFDAVLYRSQQGSGASRDFGREKNSLAH